MLPEPLVCILQDLDFDKKVRKLHKKFLHVPEAVVYHHLSAAQGNYDAAVSMLIDMDANSQTQVGYSVLLMLVLECTCLASPCVYKHINLTCNLS